MSLFDNVEEQIRLHKAMRPEDIVKLLYQNVYGKEHLLSSEAIDYFYEEYEDTPITDERLYEKISDSAIRVNIGAWKRKGLLSAWLINLFMHDESSLFSSDDQLFISLIEKMRDYASASLLPFSLSDWDCFISGYLSSGIRPLHHSPLYREKEHPHYRVLSARDIPVIDILSEIQRQNAEVIAIDGRAASGKSTAASSLSAALGGAGIIRMDDFFLPHSMRCEERLSSPGGNVHYERFSAEVIPYLRSHEAFSYSRFDCSIGKLSGSISIPDGRYRIVEGSYSAHPSFGEYYDLLVFSDIPYHDQLNRIEKRNGSMMKTRFIREWIPMEESYFSSFSIREKAQLII